ncbi:MAG TPA: hypothetical protein VFQ76_03800 [Longimicrobiaceae bacterium]|nr:hypothetical protein [Longimicrobiaceae bacterium]
MQAAKRIQAVVLGTATLLSLGFGVAQALASPPAEVSRACTTAVCHQLCVESGYSYGSCRDGRFCVCTL